MPTSEDNKRFEGTRRYIITYPSLKHFHLYGTDPDELQFSDVLQSKSNQCRWTGHVKFFYSILEHEILVARIVAFLKGSDEQQFEGLMHDTPETWLSDFAAPWKGDILNYHDHEDRIWQRVADKWHLPYKRSDVVKEADWLALFLEGQALITDGPPTEWSGWKQYGERALELPFEIVGHAPPSPTCTHPYVHLEYTNLFKQLGGAYNG